MPQVHLYVPETVAEQLRARARSLGLPISRYLAQIVTSEVDRGWPEGFFDDVSGGWKGKPLRRPPQGTLESREAL